MKRSAKKLLLATFLTISLQGLVSDSFSLDIPRNTFQVTEVPSTKYSLVLSLWFQKVKPRPLDPWPGIVDRSYKAKDI